jgi:hypothetical protein
VPEAGCLQLVRPTKSLRLLRQLQGRVLRPSPGKEKALLIDHGPSWCDLPPPDEEIAWSLDADSLAKPKGTPTIVERSTSGRIVVVARQRPEVEVRKITSEEAGMHRAMRNAEQLQQILCMHRQGRVPRAAVLSVLNRAPRSRHEFEQAAETLRWGRQWALKAFAKQEIAAGRHSVCLQSNPETANLCNKIPGLLMK